MVIIRREIRSANTIYTRGFQLVYPLWVSLFMGAQLPMPEEPKIAMLDKPEVSDQINKESSQRQTSELLNLLSLKEDAGSQTSSGGKVQADCRPGGRVGVHGMVVFGSPDSGVYMSHIPMYHAPHDMQAYFDISLPGTRKFQDGLYTFEPKKFSLDDLLSGQLNTIEGTLYQGNFEAGGKPLQDLTVRVNNVMEAKQLREDTPPEPVLEYEVLGNPKDAYLIHPISKAPNFDQIARIDLSKSTLTEADIKAGVHIVLPGKSDDVANRLSEGTVNAKVEGTIAA